MRNQENLTEDPGRQLCWMMTLTTLCAAAGVILALYTFRVL